MLEQAELDTAESIVLDGLASTLEDELRHRVLTRYATELKRGEMPPIAATEYNGEPAQYVAQVRDLLGKAEKRPGGFSVMRYDALAAQMVRESNSSAAAMVDEWLDVHAETITRFFGQPYLTKTEFLQSLLPFVWGTVEAVTTAPRTAAQLEYRHKRSEILRGFPRQTTDISEAVRSGALTDKMIAQAGRRLSQVTPSMQTPDYHALTPEQQKEIIGVVGEECLTFWRYFFQYGDVKLMKMSDGAPKYPFVLLRPVADLEKVMRYTNQPHTAIHNYIENNYSFQQEFEAACEALAGEPETLEVEEHPATMMQPGDTWQICGETETMRYKELRETLAELDVEMLKFLTGGRESIVPDRWTKPTNDAAEKIVKKTAGNILNVRLHRLAVDDEYVQSFPEDTRLGLEIDTLRRYMLTVDIKSRGVVVPTGIEIAYFMRWWSQGRAPTPTKSAKGKTTGAEALNAIFVAARESAKATGSVPHVPGMGRARIINRPKRMR